MSLISELRSRRSPVASKSRVPCPSSWPLVGRGIGMNDSLSRRPGSTSPVGPLGPMAKWASGGRYGELRIGFSSEDAVMRLRTEGSEPNASLLAWLPACEDSTGVGDPPPEQRVLVVTPPAHVGTAD